MLRYFSTPALRIFIGWIALSFASLASGAGLVDETAAPGSSQAYSTGSDTQLLAQKKKTTKKKRPKRKKRPGTGPKKGDDSASAPVHFKRSAAVRGVVGILTGLKDAKGTVLTFGADGLFALSNEIAILAGVSTWSSSSTDNKTYESSMSLMTLSTGIGYSLWFGSDMRLEFGGRGALGMLGSETTVELEDIEETTTVSETAGGIVLQAGFHYQMGSLSFGPEIRYPIWMGNYTKELGYMEALLFVEYSF